MQLGTTSKLEKNNHKHNIGHIWVLLLVGKNYSKFSELKIAKFSKYILKLLSHLLLIDVLNLVSTDNSTVEPV